MKEKIAFPRFVLLMLFVLEGGVLLPLNGWVTVARVQGQGTALVSSVMARQPWRVVVSCLAPVPITLSLDGEDGLREQRTIDCDGQEWMEVVEPVRRGMVYVALTSSTTGEWQVMVQTSLQR